MERSAVVPPNESHANVLIATVIAFLILDFIFVGLRFCSRRLQGTKARSDDYFVIASLVLICSTCATSIYAVKCGGVGRHLQYVPKPERIQWLKSVYVATPSLYIISASLPKLAVMCIYLQIFVDRASRLCCWSIICVLAVGPVITIPFVALQCRPITFLWDKTISGGHCFNQAYMFRYGSIPNIVTDVAILVLPMPLIWKLQTTRKVKVGLLITFLLGSIGLITSILRFVAFFTPIVDGTWAAVPLLCWVIVEPSIYLLAACLLASKPLLKYATKESSISRHLRSWANTRSNKTLPYIQSSNNGVTRLPSNDLKWDKDILRESEVRIDHSVASTSGEAFGMYSLSASR